MITMDEDALHAAVDVVGRCGAKQFEIGYLHDDVPVDQASWWAVATVRGAKVMAEHHASPAAAAEALAVRLMTGALCTHCGGIIKLRDDGAEVFVGTLTDGSEMTAERARSMPQCRWRRHADRWARGCTGTIPEGQRQPNRAARRAGRGRR